MMFDGNQSIGTVSGGKENTRVDRDNAGLLILFGLTIYLVTVTGMAQILAWLIEQVFQGLSTKWPFWLWSLITLLHATLAMIPTAFLALVWPRKRYRIVYQALFAISIYMLLAAPIRLVELPQIQLANLVQAIFSVGVSIFLILIYRWKYQAVPRFSFPQITRLVLILAALIILPWFAWGALGSVLDTILNLVTGLLFGLSAGLILQTFLINPLKTMSKAEPDGHLLAGFVSGIILFLMGSVFGYGGMQIPLMLMLPGLGFISADLATLRSTRDQAKTWLALSVLIGIVVAVPMMFVDPDELRLDMSIGSRDLLIWVLYASFASMTIGWLIEASLSLVRSRIKQTPMGKPINGLLILSWSFALIIFFIFGQPGFHGEQLFVVLNDEADFEQYGDLTSLEEKKKTIYKELTTFAEIDQEELVIQLDRFGINYKPYYLVNGIAVDGGPIIGYWINGRDDVDRILEIPVLRPLPSDSPISQGTAPQPDVILWNLSMIGVDRVWEEFGVTGEGITIGQSDSGVDGSHPDLESSYRGNNGYPTYSWYDPWNSTSEPVDISGHGTHTLGIIVGEKTGIAPDADWIGCVNLARNLANPAIYLECLQFMFAPFPPGGDPFTDGDPTLSADILNNSWGCPEFEGCDEGVMLNAVKALRAAGIFVVSAAGNDGPTCGTVAHPLALYEQVFSVGAIDRNEDLAYFSSLGPVTVDGSNRLKPDLVAPGVEILSTFPVGSYEILPGTSMSGPHVAGTIALMWSANPSLIGDIESTESILMETARPYEGFVPECITNSTLPNNAVGYGILDTYAAVKKAISHQ